MSVPFSISKGLSWEVSQSSSEFSGFLTVGVELKMQFFGQAPKSQQCRRLKQADCKFKANLDNLVIYPDSK